MIGEQKPFSPSEEEWFKKGEEMKKEGSEFIPKKPVEASAKPQTEKEFFGEADTEQKEAA